MYEWETSGAKFNGKDVIAGILIWSAFGVLLLVVQLFGC